MFSFLPLLTKLQFTCSFLLYLSFISSFLLHLLHDVSMHFFISSRFMLLLPFYFALFSIFIRYPNNFTFNSFSWLFGGKFARITLLQVIFLCCGCFDLCQFLFCPINQHYFTYFHGIFSFLIFYI